MNPQKVGTAELAKSIGMVFQDPESQAVGFTVEEEIAFGPENLLLSREKVLKLVDESLRKTELYDRKKEFVDYLSTGLRQRLALASALAMKPRLLLLDEPTSHLDLYSATRFYEIVKKLKGKGVSIILVEHKLDYVIELADRILFMKDGRIIKFGKKEEFIDRAIIDELIESGVWVPESWMMRYVRPLDYHKVIEGKFNEKIVRLKDIWFSYTGKEWVIRNFSFEVRRGEVLALIGPNGSGKTTLLKIISGILKPQNGSVYVINGDPNPNKVSFILQNPNNEFIGKTVLEDIEISYESKGLSPRRARSLALSDLRKYGLEKFSNVSPFKLSQGQKRLISIISMLALDREIVLLDEPTFGLDRKYSMRITWIIKDLAKSKKTVLLVTHDPWLILSTPSRIVGISEGEKIFDGDISKLFHSKSLWDKLRFIPTKTLQKLVNEFGIEVGINKYRGIIYAESVL